ncbi:MAG: DUF4127 family protein [Clostridia bacterium]|nr:DUF4127 family protein [Clostridia bacterium]
MNVVYIPLDERPCNYSFAAKIARGSKVNVIKPEACILGDKKKPADFDAVKSFMVEHANEADAYVISIDMLLYGGIVPSRLHSLSEGELCSRLEVINEIKAINPRAKIYAFALIMRCPKYSSSDEEPDYYEYCGREIFLAGQTKHKQQLGLISDEQAQELMIQYASVIGDNLADFERRREINRNMLIRAVGMLHGAIDYLIIPQDDSAQYGYTSMDREAIKAELRSLGLDDVAMYPGADEVGMTLLSRAACEYAGKSPKIYCEFAHGNSPNITPLYEDRPLKNTLPFQLECAGCVRTDHREDADVILYLNYPSCEPVEVWQEGGIGYAQRDLNTFTDGIVKDARAGRVVAIADGAYCNGGDKEFLKLLASKINILDISAYAGWNTSSNTLGTVICQAVFVYLFGDNEYQRLFFAERIYEDVGYCGHIRAYVTNSILPKMGYDYFNAGGSDGEVARIVERELERYITESFPALASRYGISECRMPWRRMFEVGLSLKERTPE